MHGTPEGAFLVRDASDRTTDSYTLTLRSFTVRLLMSPAVLTVLQVNPLPKHYIMFWQLSVVSYEIINNEGRQYTLTVEE